ncbi:MAG TPA: (2Fe-2S)-binding protein [Burkholderiales bacterium]|nr:(2Fe-2S)-binding protein [Burkholderiales bacterium]
MFICVCNAVTDREIRQCAELGVASVADLKDSLGVAAGCGRCECAADEILRECARAGGSQSD